MRVSVHVEGLRVRTLVDHIYYNRHGTTLEGTFTYSLPNEASISYYAMFVGADATEPPDFFGPHDALADADLSTLAKAAPKEVADGADTDVWESRYLSV